MQFVPPTLDGITRKRPCLDAPLMPTLPEAQACVQTSVPGTTLVKSSPSRSDPYCPDELDEISRLMNMARNRYTELVNKHTALRQDAIGLQSKLGELQVALENEKASTGRAYTSITELQTLGGHLMERVRALGNLRGTINQKRESIDELINSMQEVKQRVTDEYQRVTAENAQLSAELENERKEGAELANRLKESIAELEKTRANLEEELSTVRDDRKGLKEELCTLNERYERNQEELKRSIDRGRGELCEKDRLCQEYKKEICELILTLTRRLGCHPPATFGDGSSQALGVVVDECIVEHKAAIDGKEQERLELIETLQLANGRAEDKITQLEAELTLHRSAEETKNQGLAADLAKREQYIQKLENRIAEMQFEASGNANKLAEVQKLRVIYQVVQEMIFQGQDINDIEYADLRSLITEELSHNACNDKIQKVETRAVKQGIECENLRNQLQTVRREALAREKALQDKITALVAQLDAQDGTVSRSASIGSKDKTVVEGLIQLIEKDTQELKAISVGKTSSSNMTPSQPVRRGRSANRASSSAHRFNKRSPLPSNQSEIDLWSIFANKKSK